MANGSNDFIWGALIISLLIVLAIILTPILLIGVPAYVFYRLWRDNPKRLERLAREETLTLYRHAISGSAHLSDREVETALAAYWSRSIPNPLYIQLQELGRALYEAEGLSPEVPPPPALCNTIEGARYRDMLARTGQALNDRVMTLSALDIISQSLATIANIAPHNEGDVLVNISQFAHPLNHAVQNVIAPFFQDTDYNHFKALNDRLNANMNANQRSNPVFPRDYKGDDVIDTYLGGTILKELFDLKTPFEIPEAHRFEHTHIVAGSGHGKTQTLQYFIARDLVEVARGDKSVVVIDSQGDLINTILSAKHLPPEKIVLIDAEDIGFPVSLNLFSVGQDRLEGYNALDRERLANSIIELYDFVLGSLLSAGMTAKQSVVFRYVTRLMFHIPDATIHTLRELMEEGGTQKYRASIQKLEGTPRRFFESEFDSKEFTNTKTQVLRRLYGVLENRTFERMFSNPESKFDMFTELNQGKLILINTSKSLLKEQGTEIFGRFFIALIAQAAQERATLRDSDRLPAMVYIDEAQDYFDHNISVILSQARKYRVGVVLAHQFLGQLTTGLQEAFEANTAIKLAGGVSARDARALAGQMAADPNLTQQQPKGTFATFVRGLTERAVPISFPFFVMEKMDRASAEDRDAIRAHSRKTYANPWDEAGQGSKSGAFEHSEDSRNTADHGDTEGTDKTVKNDHDDPTAPSPEL